MRKAQFFYLLRRGLLSGGLNLITEGLVMASKFITQGLSFPAQGSAEFDGASDYIRLTESFSNTENTLCAWIYYDGSATSNEYPFDNRDESSDDGIQLFIRSDDTIRYRLNSESVTSTSTPINEWFFVSGTYDGDIQTLYINGSIEHQRSSVSTTIDVNAGSRIGVNYTEANFFNGNLANVAIWNRALSSDEINSVMWKSYEALSGAESNGLQAWYSLDDITSPAASLANMEQLAADKEATIENKAAITAAINALS